MHNDVENGNNTEEIFNQRFIIRESTLTVLMATSAHYRTLYYIFMIVIMLIFLDTVSYDFIGNGKLNFGSQNILFDKIWYALLIWCYELSIAILFHPGIRLYAIAQRPLNRQTGARYGISIIGAFGVLVIQTSLLGVPLWILHTECAWVSASILIAESFRFAMKIHAVMIVCNDRFNENKTSLPSFKDYMYFLFAPTLIYKDEYPRTKIIRWGMAMYYGFEVMAIIFFICFLWKRFIYPQWSDYGKQSTVEAATVVRGIITSTLPGLLIVSLGSYSFLHAWLNGFAELLRFGDRLFYEDWWTSPHVARYFRTLNCVVHFWLQQHVYLPIMPYLGRTLSVFVVFFVSALAHEVVLTYTVGFVYPILFIQFGLIGYLLLPLTIIIGRRFPNITNFVMWLLLFIGHGLLWSLYSMEYFARKNCPQSPDDSILVPKSWSCPKIVFNSNWTFQNPLL